MLVGKVLLGLSSVMLLLLLSAVDPASAEDFSRVESRSNVVSNQSTESGKQIAAHQYRGYLRLFVSEPVSRFSNDLGQPHLHGVIGYPLDIEFTLNYPDTLRGDLVYNDVGMSEGNIEVIGAVYENAGHTNYSDPPTGKPFTAHWVDAAAVANPGVPGFDDATPPYTHKVFVEYATRYS